MNFKSETADGIIYVGSHFRLLTHYSPLTTGCAKIHRNRRRLTITSMLSLPSTSPQGCSLPTAWIPSLKRRMGTSPPSCRPRSTTPGPVSSLTPDPDSYTSPDSLSVFTEKPFMITKSRQPKDWGLEKWRTCPGFTGKLTREPRPLKLQLPHFFCTQTSSHQPEAAGPHRNSSRLGVGTSDVSSGKPCPHL